MAQSMEFAKKLAPLPIVISPVTRVEHIEISGLTTGKILVVTSSNALTSISAQKISLTGLNMYCVGSKTAKLAVDLGARVTKTADTAKQLLDEILADNPDEGLLYIRGQEISIDLKKRLNSAGIDTDEMVAYRVHEQDLTPQANELIRGSGTVVMPVFSVNSAIRLSKKLGTATCKIVLVTMSKKVSDAWVGPKPDEVVVAEDPTSAAMVRAITSHSA